VPDQLGDIPPRVYVEALTGLVPTRDGKVSCPLQGHEDGTPSMQVYQDAERGWYCFGCEQGGGVYQLAAILGGYPLPLRGEDFLRVRGVLLDHLTTAEAA
jgi:DNA primase